MCCGDFTFERRDAAPASVRISLKTRPGIISIRHVHASAPKQGAVLTAQAAAASGRLRRQQGTWAGKRLLHFPDGSSNKHLPTHG